MKYLIPLVLFAISCSDLRTKPKKYPQIISLTTKAEPPKNHNRAFDEHILNPPNFGVDQYHEGLKKYHSQDRGSLLCQPTSIAMALIYDRKFHPKGKTIELKTLKGKSEVDGNEVVEELMTCTKTDPALGSKSSDSANCLLGLNYEVKFIGNFGSNGFLNFKSEVETMDRVPTTQDIMKYLKAGYHILGNADYYKLEKDKWILGPGHVVFIHGFARNKHWPPDLLYLYINDPDYIYNSTNSLKYQQILVSKVAHSDGLPPFTSKLSLEGGAFTNLNSRAFLDSILIFKLK